MPTLPNMNLITPELGGDSGTWDDKINVIFGQVDDHNHTSGKGVPVPVSGLNINANIPLAGFALTGAGRVEFSAVAALSSGQVTLFVNSSDNELYWRTNAGVNVKLTSGSSINTSLVGGIVGDYSSVGAEVAYDNSNSRYTFKDADSPQKKWARIACGPVRVFEFDTTESVYVEIAVATGLAAPYTVTLPTALPGSTKPVYIDASGNIGFTAPDKVLALPGAAWQSNDSDVTYNHTFGTAVVSPGTATLVLPIPLHTGDRIKSITVAVLGNVAGDADINPFDVRVVTASGGTTEIGTTLLNNVTASTWVDITIDLTDTTLAAGETVSARILVSGGTGTALEIGNTRITYTPGN